jgi:hypothetical protein
MIEKCKYYADSQTACSLMIDDLVPVAVSSNGTISASNDWGFLMDGSNSLYSYFNDQILNKYPEIKGSVFLPLSSQNYIPVDKGYKIYKNQVDSTEFLSFIQRISDHFEMAFHGDKHGYMKDNVSTAECSSVTKAEIESILSAVNSFSERTKINFEGGKFPAYSYNNRALKIINRLEAKWWSLDVSMINKASNKNALKFDEQLNIVLVPTNVCGDIFKYYFIPPKRGLIPFIINILKYLLGRRNKYSDPVRYLDYLYKNKFPIIIQEHFQSIRTDGRRQTPSIYDDIFSLDLIFAFLRGKDVWHATCSEIAHYYESYIHSNIDIVDEMNFVVSYNGIYKEPLLSLKLTSPKIYHKETRKEIQGILKNNEYWIFNNILKGNYSIGT